MARSNDSKGAKRSTTPAEPLIAEMYERWTLDIVIKLVQLISKDFVDRPRQYRTVPFKDDGSVARILQDFWFLTGTDPNFPDLMKREMIFVPLLGASDGMIGEKISQFHNDSGALRERARAFTERQVETGEDNLRRAFLDEVITFRSYLETLVENAVVSNGDRQTRAMFDRAVLVLLDEAVAGVFGRPPSSVAGWPLGGTFDVNGARVIEEVAKALDPAMIATQSQFVIMQRIGSFGAETIRGVLAADLDPDPVSQIDPLIQVTYSWKTALDALAR